MLDLSDGHLQGLPAPVLIATPFPSTSDHNARHIEIGPDGKLYISYGSPANVDTCEQYENINSCSIIRMNMNGTQIENYLVGELHNPASPYHSGLFVYGS